MQEKLEAFVSENNLFCKNDRILIALSGGVDSVVLATLMHKANYNIALAHCNFHLRDEESNRDEAFVRSWAKKNNVELFVKEFDTYGYMKENKISLEMAARDLRYEWFNSLMETKKFDFLCTAHHLDDSIETFLSIFCEVQALQDCMEYKQKMIKSFVPFFLLQEKIF